MTERTTITLNFADKTGDYARLLPDFNDPKVVFEITAGTMTGRFNTVQAYYDARKRAEHISALKTMERGEQLHRECEQYYQLHFSTSGETALEKSIRIMTQGLEVYFAQNAKAREVLLSTSTAYIQYALKVDGKDHPVWGNEENIYGKLLMEIRAKYAQPNARPQVHQAQALAVA